MRFEMRETSRLTTGEREALRRLSEAVYPPEVAAAWPGRLMEWDAAPWVVLCWDEDGQSLAHVGVHLRECRANHDCALIGGIGGVKTHPDARCQGLASEAIGIAVKFLAEQRAGFALLTCEPDLVRFYERLGWRLFPGNVFVTQLGERVQFNFDLSMILSLIGVAPTGGEIDLLGPPW